MTRDEFRNRLDYIAMCSGGASKQENELLSEYDRLTAEISFERAQKIKAYIINTHLLEMLKEASRYIADVTMQSVELGDPDLHGRIIDAIHAEEEKL
jgi:hypothetical protein